MMMMAVTRQGCFCQVVLYREKEILNTEADMSALHELLADIPDNLPIEHLLSVAGDLYIQYPPTVLTNEALERFRRSVYKKKFIYGTVSKISFLSKEKIFQHFKCLSKKKLMLVNFCVRKAVFVNFCLSKSIVSKFDSNLSTKSFLLALFFLIQKAWC
jgi:hypothetical protein